MTSRPLSSRLSLLSRFRLSRRARPRRSTSPALQDTIVPEDQPFPGAPAATRPLRRGREPFRTMIAAETRYGKRVGSYRSRGAPRRAAESESRFSRRGGRRRFEDGAEASTPSPRSPPPRVPGRRFGVLFSFARGGRGEATTRGRGGPPEGGATPSSPPPSPFLIFERSRLDYEMFSKISLSGTSVSFCTICFRLSNLKKKKWFINL